MTATNELTYHPDEDLYTPHPAATVKDARKATAEDLVHFVANEYSRIFSAYDPETDYVSRTTPGDEVYLALKRYGNPEFPDRLKEGGVLKLVDRSFGNIGIRNVPLTEVTMADPVDAGANSSDRLLRDMECFFDAEEIYDSLGMERKRGALLYGPPGNGKTFQVLQAVRKLVNERNAFVFFMYSDRFMPADLLPFRPIFADRPTVFVFDELTEFKGRFTKQLLNFLDGELSWPNNYSVATTNCPADLPVKFVERPGRFDRLLSVDRPDREQRRRFLTAYLKDWDVSEELMDNTESFSISYLKELVLRTRLYGLSPESAAEQLRGLKNNAQEAFRDPEEIPGFSFNETGDIRHEQ